jgi:cytochrome c oxidase assembly protein Cox11
MKKLVGKFSKAIKDVQHDVKKSPGTAVMFIILGIPFLVLGVYFIAMNVSFMSRTVATYGTVVDERISPYIDDYGSHYSIPIIEFKTSEGELITFVDGEVDVSVGQKVKVRYNPSNPFDARIYSVSNYWVLPSLFGVGSAVFSSIGLWGLISKFISQRKSRLKAQVD